MNLGNAYDAVAAERDKLREALKPFAGMARMIDTLPKGGYLHGEMIATLGVHGVTQAALDAAKELIPPPSNWHIGWRDSVTGDVGTTLLSGETSESVMVRFHHMYPLRAVTNIYESIIKN